MKLMIMGYGGHGKDTVASLFDPMTYISSSWAAAERVVFPVLSLKYNYQSAEDCYADRRQRREEWFNLIRDYNTPDLTRLAREIYAEFDIYVGVRNPAEFNQIRLEGLFDHSIWVDASERLPPEDASSNGLCADDADFFLDNNGPEEDLESQVTSLRQILGC